MLKISLDSYAMDYDGHYPERLEDLVSSGNLKAEVLARLRLCRTSRTDPGTPWTYLGAGMKNTDDPDTPMLISPPFPRDGRIIVLRLDGSARAVRLPTDDPKLRELLER